MTDDATRVAELESALRMLRDAWNAHMATCPGCVSLPTFEQVEAWRNAPSNTASAHIPQTPPDRAAEPICRCPSDRHTCGIPAVDCEACGDPECEALCEPSGDGYSRCAAHATPKRVTNAELRREAERLAPFSPRARPHATPDRVAMGVGVDPQFLRLLRGEITAAEWGDWAERQYGYDTQEAFDACKALGQHARWWFLHGAMVGIAVGILVLLAVQVIHG